MSTSIKRLADVEKGLFKLQFSTNLVLNSAKVIDEARSHRMSSNAGRDSVETVLPLLVNPIDEKTITKIKHRYLDTFIKISFN